MKKITIILCIYNAEAYLHDALDSIVNQSIDIDEIIVIDDGSTDNSSPIVEEYISNKYNKISLYKQSNKGLTVSLNKAIKISSGDYIVRMDADDISLPNRIEETIKYIEDNDLDSACTKALRIKLNGEKVSSVPRINHNINNIKLDLMKFGNPFVHGSFVFKKEIFDRIEYDETYRTAQDYDLICNMIKSGFKVGYLNKPLYILRIDPNSSGRNPNSTQVKNACKIAKKYFGTDNKLLILKPKPSRIYLSLIKKIFYER